MLTNVVGGGKTEIDRIKSEGWLPQDFFKEETRCGHFVSKKTKEIWAILLDLYREFARICDKYDLEYFGNGGTVLGAVRHKGFIPWDDDIDILMPRKSYNKLITLAKEFRHPYFLQYITTDPEYCFSYIKMRNSNTTAFGGSFIYSDFNYGMFIDIMPLDKALNLDEYAKRRKQIEELIMYNSAFMRLSKPNKSEHDNEVISKYYDGSKSPMDIINEITEICSLHESEDCPYLCQITPSMGYAPEHKFWRKEVFDGYVVMPVEGVPMRQPKLWDEYLTNHFNNYMQLPPLEQRMAHDFDVNPYMPYVDYFKEKLGVDLKRR